MPPLTSVLQSPPLPTNALPVAMPPPSSPQNSLVGLGRKVNISQCEDRATGIVFQLIRKKKMMTASSMFQQLTNSRTSFSTTHSSSYLQYRILTLLKIQSLHSLGYKRGQNTRSKRSPLSD